MADYETDPIVVQRPLTYDEKIRSQMPANLRAIADRNLATEDASVQRFNDIAQYASRKTVDVTDPNNLVTPGGFQSAVPTTDVLRAQRSVPDLIGNAIEARRTALAQALATNTDPDASARYVDPRRRVELTREFSEMNNAAHENAITQAQQTHQTFVQQQNIRSANDFTGLAHDLAGIPFDSGTPEYAKATLGIVAAHPYGSQTAAGKDLLSMHAKIHDGASHLSPEDKDYWQNFKQSFKDASEFARTAGVDVQYDEQGNPSIERTRDYAKDKGVFVKPGANAKDPLTEELYKGYKLTPGQILNPIEVKAGKYVGSKFEYDKQGDVYEVNAGGGAGKVKMPKAAFDRFQQGFAPAADENAATAPAATATPAPANITQDEYAKLKSGDTYQWNGRTLKKK